MLSPPLDIREKWFAGHSAYSIAKSSISSSSLASPGEFRGRGVAVNTLPRSIWARVVG